MLTYDEFQLGYIDGWKSVKGERAPTPSIPPTPASIPPTPSLLTIETYYAPLLPLNCSIAP